MNIIINANNYLYSDNVIYYGDVVHRAFPTHNPQSKIFTVTYYSRGESLSMGSLYDGESVIPREGMVFNVANTSNA